jgi:hypothetical protein
MKSLKGIPAVFIALAAILALAGAAMALWWESLLIDVTVETGTLDAQLSVHGYGDNEIELATQMNETTPEVKDVSNITCTLSEDGKTINVLVQNAYPSITYFCEIDLKNTGTIPFKIYSIDFSGNLTDVAEEFGFNNSVIVEGLQLEPGDEVSDTLVIHLSNNAMEDTVYTGEVTIVVEQWNEYPTSP